MYCKNCGAWNDDDAKFCKRCGIAVEGKQNPSFERSSTVSNSINKEIAFLLIFIVTLLSSFYKMFEVNVSNNAASFLIKYNPDNKISLYDFVIKINDLYEFLSKKGGIDASKVAFFVIGILATAILLVGLLCGVFKMIVDLKQTNKRKLTFWSDYMMASLIMAVDYGFLIYYFNSLNDTIRKCQIIYRQGQYRPGEMVLNDLIVTPFAIYIIILINIICAAYANYMRTNIKRSA